MPTTDGFVAYLSGSTVFSKLDLKAGYHHIELAPESRYLTTFSTHIGLFRYKRLDFGVCSASEVFQNQIRLSLQGLDGVINVGDDILIHGKTQKEHNRWLESILLRLRDTILTLNSEKYEYNKSSITFYGFIFSKGGLSRSSKSRCNNSTDVKRFLGMVQYCSRFIADLATLSKPLRYLTKQNADFVWTTIEEQALNIKQALSSDATMTYCDPSKATELIIDASPVGLRCYFGSERQIKHESCFVCKSFTESRRTAVQPDRTRSSCTYMGYSLQSSVSLW